MKPAPPAGAQVATPNGPIYGPKAPKIDHMTAWLEKDGEDSATESTLS